MKPMTKQDVDNYLKKQDEKRKKEHQEKYGWTKTLTMDRPDCEFCDNPLLEKFKKGEQLNEMKKHRDRKHVTFFTGWRCGNEVCKNFDKLVAIKTEYEVRNVTGEPEFKMIHDLGKGNIRVFGGLK